METVFCDALLNINNDNGHSLSIHHWTKPLIDDPSYEKVIKAINKFKNNKAPEMIWFLLNESKMGKSHCTGSSF